MAEENKSNGQAGAQQQSPSGKTINIQRIYVKDFSFESPQSPEVFTWQDFGPQFNLNLATRTKQVQDDIWEVILEVTVEATQNEKAVFLAELQQAGLFLVQGFNQEEIGSVLGGFCPAQLYPYAREVITGMVVNGGFPAPHLQPVNFDQLYMRQLQEQQQRQQASQEQA
jgi:preprotein translocase subunit SecB